MATTFNNLATEPRLVDELENAYNALHEKGTHPLSEIANNMAESHSDASVGYRTTFSEMAKEFAVSKIEKLHGTDLGSPSFEGTVYTVVSSISLDWFILFFHNTNLDQWSAIDMTHGSIHGGPEPREAQTQLVDGALYN